MRSKSLFVIMPFGVRPLETGEPHDFDSFYREVLRPLAADAGYAVSRVDEVVETGEITDQAFKYLMNSDVVVADVSSPNGNVYYELGIRQAISSGRTILVAIKGTTLPFDIATQRVLFYDRQFHSDKLFQRSFTGALSTDLPEPVSRVRQSLESMGLSLNPATDQATFEQEFNHKIERASSVEQLVAVWHWAKNFPTLPTSGLLKLSFKLAKVGDFVSAALVLQAGYPQAEEDYEVHRQRGFYLRKAGDYSGAKDELGNALTLNPNDPEALGMLGGLYKREQNYREALNYYRRGLVLSPDSLYLRVAFAGTLLIADMVDDAKSGFDIYKELYDSITNNPLFVGDFWAELVLAEASVALGYEDAAYEHAGRAVGNGAGRVELESTAEQILLLGEAGINPDLAGRLGKVLLDAAGDPSVLANIAAPGLSDTRRGVAAGPSGPKLIFHLSDVHFGSKLGKDSKPIDMHRFVDSENSRRLSLEMIDEISRAIRRTNCSPGDVVLVISGDLTYTATENEFHLVNAFLSEICEKVGVGRDQVLLVPGNHDVNWAAAKQNLAHRFDDYLVFAHRFYGEQLFRERFPLIKWNFQINEERPKANQIVLFARHGDVTFVGLNSCVFEDDQNHYGFVGKAQLDNIARLLRGSTGVHFAIMHHHLLPYPESLAARTAGDVFLDMSTVRDAGLVEKRLEKLGFSLVMHGHKHKPQLRESLVLDRFDESDAPRPLIISGCGSTGVSEEELEHSQSNHYAIIEPLRYVRQPATEFLRIEWRELSFASDAEWATIARRTVKG
ncbi:metallophosphoesterase [Mycobacterium paraffinicum]|uniref:metallophosphoesterase n=1 Tax=Mycobacterium paraffinicum TaxID=53378 RepID=UPI000A066A0D|nr:metallophosphoesterase [Mycobacterium paraffinicum]